MARPSITWLITDTHFNHGAMVELCGRPADFTALTLKNLRHNLAPQDLLIHLGDVIFYDYPGLGAMMDSVPGRKVLTLGNHDRKPASWYMNRGGFAFAAESFVIGDIVFSHKPMETLPSGARLNIHGHWHQDRHHDRPSWYSEATHKLLALEDTKYQPVRLIDFIK